MRPYIYIKKFRKITILLFIKIINLYNGPKLRYQKKLLLKCVYAFGYFFLNRKKKKKIEREKRRPIKLTRGM